MTSVKGLMYLGDSDAEVIDYEIVGLVGDLLTGGWDVVEVYDDLGLL